MRAKDVPLTEAQREVVEANLGLVGRWAKGASRGTGIDYWELFSAGVVGLCRGVQRYREGKGMALSSYLTWYVRGAISDEVHRLRKHGFGGQKGTAFVRPTPLVLGDSVLDPPDDAPPVAIESEEREAGIALARRLADGRKVEPVLVALATDPECPSISAAARRLGHSVGGSTQAIKEIRAQQRKLFRP